MIKTMTADVAREQFFQILEEAEAGAEIIIERDNRPVARLGGVPEPELSPEALAQQRLDAIARMQQWAKEAIIGPPLTIEETISARDEGRRL